MGTKLVAAAVVAALILVAAFARSAPAEEDRATGPNRDHSTTAPALVVQTGHGDSVNAVAWSPNGSYLVSGSSDRTARLWEARSGREIRTFGEHRDEVLSVAFSPDGATVLTSSKSGTAHLWDVETGREIRSFACPSCGADACAFCPDGESIVTARAGAARWSTDTGELLRRYEGHTLAVRSVSVSPDGTRLLTGSADGTVCLWDLETGEEQWRVGPAGSRGFFDPHAAFSADGSRVVAMLADGTARSLDTVTGRELHRLAVGGHVCTYAWFLPDGEHVLTGNYADGIRLWHVPTKRCVLQFTSPETQLMGASLSPDGTRVAGGLATGQVVLWSTRTGHGIRVLGSLAAPLPAVAVSAAETHYLTGSTEGTVHVWDAATGREERRIHAHRGTVRSIACSPDGRLVLTGSNDNTACLWDLSTGGPAHCLEGHSGDVQAVAFAPNGRHVLTGSADYAGPRLWDVRTGREALRLQGDIRGVHAVTFTPDGGHALTGNFDTNARLWETSTGREVRRFEGHQSKVNAVAVSADGTLALTGSSDDTARLWEVATGREIRRFTGHGEDLGGARRGYVTSVAFSPDGARALTSSGDRTVRLWNVATGEEVFRCLGHTAPVMGAAYAAHGRRIVSVSDDRTTRLWSSEDGRLLGTLVSFEHGGWVVATPDGRFDASDLEEIEGLHWVMPDDPMRALSIEVFMRDYYEPRLLPRILAGERLRPVEDLASLNRAQPHVTVESIGPDPEEEGAVAVTVEIGSRSHEFHRAGGKVAMESGACDLRLFRDGQLVAWQDGALDVRDGDRRLTFPGVRTAPEGGSVSFSAYAFNTDGVKSPTARASYAAPPAERPVQGTAYVVAFGVDEFADPQWNLSYAAADAELYAARLGRTLRAAGIWERVVTVPLTSTKGRNRARRDDLRVVLAALAGEAVDEGDVRRIPMLAQIEEVRPEDLVILAFSTHGLATADGGFLLLPSDVGGGDGEAPPPSSCISTDDLAVWLRPVDAGALAMIVDACQSAASVEQAGFKPGPMGSRGFGQLAWDKKMLILAASQAAEYALESGRVRHGLLTYALVEDGIARGHADFEPEDSRITLREWLRFGAARVPDLARELARGQARGATLRGPLQKASRMAAASLAQTPSLFDFARSERDVPLTNR